MDSGQRAKILVADDSAAERAMTRQALSEAGYAVVEATDGQAALEVFARERPALVMLDVVMPRLTGLEACRIIKARTQSSYVPVIMLSSRNSVNARVEGLRSGADDYLGKPYEREELLARIEALLRARAALHDPKPGVTRTSLLVQADPAEGPAAADEAASVMPPHRRRLVEEFERAECYSDPLACLRIELDQFDVLAAQLGAEGAATQVTALRERIEQSVRKVDLVFRVDERGYLVILPNTHFPGALTVAERVVRDTGKARVAEAGGAALSCSVGVSFYPNKQTSSAADLERLVEAALERARSERGGRICLYQHQGYIYAPEP